MKTTLVFVTRNEQAGLLNILPQIDFSIYDQVFAVDGNSTDGTREIFRDYGIEVIRQKRSGLGAATLEARQHCTTEAMIFFHPDGNENYQDIPKFINHLESGYDFIIASRMIKGAYNEDDSQVLKWRKWANLGFALIANTLFGNKKCKVSDVVQGFRAITCEAFDRMALDMENCTIDYQMVIRALKLKLKIAEFPTIEGHRIDGATNFASIPTGIAEVKMLLREIVIGKSFLQNRVPKSNVIQPLAPFTGNR